MTQAACLHPNPGWTGAESPFSSSPQSPSATDMVGKHCILELYNCDPAKLDDEAFLRNAITSAAKRAGATLLNLITHRFEPQGVTGLALLVNPISPFTPGLNRVMRPWMCSPVVTTPCRSVPASCSAKSSTPAATSSRVSAVKPPVQSPALTGNRFWRPPEPRAVRLAPPLWRGFFMPVCPESGQGQISPASCG